jgi:hypothetical protein
MSSLVNREGAKFIIDFGPITIPSAVEKELEADFQRVAFAQIARLDFRGDLRIGWLPTGTYGIIFEFPDTFFSASSGRVPTPTARDHTEIIKAIMEQPLAVVHNLKGPVRERRKPSRIEVLEAAAQLPHLDTKLRATLAIAVQVSKELDSVSLPPDASKAMAKIVAEIDKADGIDELVRTLRNMEQDREYQKTEGLPAALTFARQVIEDGRDSIYSPAFSFYQNIGGGPTVAYSVAKEDAKGIVGGFMAGFATGLATTGPGGVVTGGIGGLAGGLGASAAEVVSELWDWIFD